jgi:hypothetical protein
MTIESPPSFGNNKPQLENKSAPIAKTSVPDNIPIWGDIEKVSGDYLR